MKCTVMCMSQSKEMNVLGLHTFKRMNCVVEFSMINGIACQIASSLCKKVMNLNNFIG